MSFFLDKLCHPQKKESDKSYEHASKIFNFGENLSFSDFVDYIWENPDSISCDEHTRPQCDFLLYRTYDSYFALEKIKEANQIIQEKMGIQIADIRDKNSIFTSKGCEYTSAISSKTKASEIKTYLDQNIVPMVDNMFTQDMIKKVATLYLHDIILYYNEIQGGDIELNQWISKAIADK
jgi:predicted ribosome quality control (RQC) complex YloA/Tae2 family protein